MLLGNTAQIDVTPTLGTAINGEFTTRYANKIADSLFAKGIYLNDGDHKLLIIVVDICVMKRDFLDPIKNRIYEVTGIPPSNQLISSTHTHSAGSTADLLMGHVDLAYRHFLANQLVELSIQVCSESQALKIAFGKLLKPEHLRCRRYRMSSNYSPMNPVLRKIDAVKTNPFGAEDHIVGPASDPDPEVCFIGLKTLNDSWVGLLANYNLHYVGDCARGTITADYFGYFSQRIQDLLGSENMVAIMSNGSSGEINNWNFTDEDHYPKSDHLKSKFIGEDIAAGVFGVIPTLHWDEDATIAVEYADMTLKKRSITEEIKNRSLALLARTDYESLSYTDEDLLEKVYAREQVLLESVPSAVSVPLQGIRIGKTIIGGLGGEFFSVSGQKLKHTYPYYFNICLANDYIGYVPPLEEFENGGYETWRCRSSFLEEAAEEKIRYKLTDIIKRLAQHES